jgi:hypothetical protein
VPYLKHFWSKYSKQKLLFNLIKQYIRVLLHIINITLIAIVPSHDKKFVKFYEFDLIFITEYIFLIRLLKMHFSIIIIIVFLVS